MLHEHSYLFYQSLIILRFLNENSPIYLLQYGLKITRWLKVLKHRSDICPQNFKHHYLFVLALWKALFKRFNEAQQYFENAIELAEERGFVHEAAMAQEAYGEFLLQQQQAQAGKLQILNAHQNFLKWKASAMVHALEKRYPQYFS